MSRPSCRRKGCRRKPVIGSSFCPDHAFDVPDIWHELLRNMALCRLARIRLPERFYEDFFDAVHGFERGEIVDAVFRCVKTAGDYWLAAGEHEARRLERMPWKAETSAEKELAAIVRHSKAIAQQHERHAKSVKSSGEVP